MDHEYNKQKKLDRMDRAIKASCKPVAAVAPRPRDFEVNDQGSIILFTPLTQAARDWIADNVQEDAQYFGRALVVEHRYASDLAQGMLAAGLTA